MALKINLIEILASEKLSKEKVLTTMVEESWFTRLVEKGKIFRLGEEAKKYFKGFGDENCVEEEETPEDVRCTCDRWCRNLYND